ncbi:MAG: DUF447 family protein [Candidatus Lokiarchaeota archaeon]|nr:DUF447 family protein [Candidatus Lokiarchaeota archaeon]
MSWEKSSILSIDLFTEKFDLRKNTIYETIVTTLSNDSSSPHAAPMGIIFEKDYILIKPYKTSRTYKFINLHKIAGINFIDDLELFYIFSREDKNMSEYKEFFKTISEFTIPIFKKSNLSIEVKVKEDLNKEDVRAAFKCEPLRYIHKIEYRKKFDPINRATGCILESIIHSTRVSLFRKLDREDLKSKIENLIFLLEHYREVIEKVNPESKYSWIIDDIFKRLKLD